MNNKNDLDNIFINSFLENDWTKYLPFFASNFLIKYYENIPFLKKELEVLTNKKNKEITLKEQMKINKVLSIISLKNMIIENYETKTIDVDYINVKNSFSDISKKSEIMILKKINEEMYNDSEQQFNTSFKELENEYQWLITYIKKDEAKIHFFKTYLLEGKKDELFFDNNQLSTYYTNI